MEPRETEDKKSERGRGEAEISFSASPFPSPSHFFFVLAPLFARSLISRGSILDDLLAEKRRLLAVHNRREMESSPNRASVPFLRFIIIYIYIFAGWVSFSYPTIM